MSDITILSEDFIVYYEAVFYRMYFEEKKFRSEENGENHSPVYAPSGIMLT